MPARSTKLSALAGRCIGGMLSRGGEQGRLFILTYHRILPEPDPIVSGTMDRATFAMQMQCLKGGFNVLPLTEAAEALARGSLPPRAACVTFDDGYADNCTTALPILERLALPATFFIATGFIDGGRMWNDTIVEAVRRAPAGRLDLHRAGLGEIEIVGDAERRRLIERAFETFKYLELAERAERVAALAEAVGRSLPDDLMMTSGQILRLRAAGMELGAHTVCHPILARLTEREAAHEIAASRATLEAVTGVPVTAFAYPNGKPGIDYGPEHVAMVRRAGFRAAVSTVRGCARRSCDLLQLPRVGAWQRTPLAFTLGMSSVYLDDAPVVA